MKSTIPVTIRLPTDVVEKVDRRVTKSVRYKTRGGYLRDMITWEVRRDHNTKKKGDKHA